MNNEFEQANELLRGCVATIACGCSMRDDEVFDSLTLFRLAKEYV